MDFDCGLCNQKVSIFRSHCIEMARTSRNRNRNRNHNRNRRTRSRTSCNSRKTRRMRTLRGRKQRGGSLGRIPASATVSIQQDPYSARMLVDTETAEDVFDARGPYLL